MPNKLYGSGEDLGKEKAGETSLQEPGSYMAVIGKTYRGTYGKQMLSRIVADFFLVNRTIDKKDGPDVIKLMELTSIGGKQEISFLKGTDGKAKTFGVMFRFSSPDMGSSVAATNFLNHQRRLFAKALGAFDEKEETIDWKRIQRLAGRLVSFNLVDNPRTSFLNIDPKTIQLYDASVNEDSLKKCYDVIEQEEAMRAMAKTNPAAAHAAMAPPPPEDPLPSESTAQPKKVEDDSDLPF